MSLGSAHNPSILNQSLESFMNHSKFEEVPLSRGYEEARHLVEAMIKFFRTNFGVLDSRKFSFNQDHVSDL